MANIDLNYLYFYRWQKIPAGK